MPAPRDTPDSSDETAVKPAEVLRDATDRFTPGTLLAGRYRIVSPLGKGGMGEVYRADDIRIGQPVALKFRLFRGICGLNVAIGRPTATVTTAYGHGGS